MIKDIMEGLGDHPYAVVAESDTDIGNVIKEANRLSKPGDVLIAIMERRGIEKRLLPAYINACLRYGEGSMHSDSISIETILFIAGNMNISNALDEVGADGSRFILFSSSRELAEKLARRCGLKKIRKIKLVLDQDVASEVSMTAIRYGK